MAKVAHILVNVAAPNLENKTFSYVIPDEYRCVSVGWRVLVPFGPRLAEGFVLAISDEEAVEGLKAFARPLDDICWFDDNMISTARWINQHYLCSLLDAFRLFIPGKKGIRIQRFFTVAQPNEDGETGRTPVGTADVNGRVWQRIRQLGSISEAKLRQEFGRDADKAIRHLQQNKWITAHVSASSKGKPRYAEEWELAVSRQQAAEYLKTLRRKPGQSRLLGEIIARGRISLPDLAELGITRQTAGKLAAGGIVRIAKIPVFRASYAAEFPSSCQDTYQFTPDQKTALAVILPELAAHRPKSFLLHGVTGSGKTQVYIEAVREVRRCGRQAIILVPEIALTSQIVRRFRANFGNDVVVMHSRLSEGERFDSWRRLRTGQAGIVVGARSAIFAPVTDLGIIVMDEEHEFTYKQEDSPRYHVRDVALKRADLAGAALLMGSATPAVETYAEALNGKHILITMPHRVDGSSLPQVNAVDMREELKHKRRGVISPVLQQLISETLIAREQVIILLNRRGFATFVLCRECGQVMKCSHCAISMVYHKDSGRLACHYCQRTMRVPDVCPSCGSRYIRFFGTGTQRVEEELAQRFPAARIVRMDQDTTGKKYAHERILNSFARGEYDILLGTQMVAKGHDIPNVTAVGIISADSALYLPDFRSAERTFSLITQAAGRAGRGARPGRVVVQTYNPDHYAVKAALCQDYRAFFDREVQQRKELAYPPYSRLLKITVLNKEEGQAFRLANAIMQSINQRFAAQAATEAIGPFPAAVSRVNDFFRIHILLKTRDLEAVAVILRSEAWFGRHDVILDVDPVSI